MEWFGGFLGLGFDAFCGEPFLDRLDHRSSGAGGENGGGL